MSASASRKEYQREWYIKNRAKKLAQTRAYQQAHKEDYARVAKEWRDKNPDKVSAIQKRFRNKNVEAARLRCRDWYSRRCKDADQVVRLQKKSKRYYQEHREELLRKNREWRLANKEALAAQQKRYNDAHREKRSAQNRARSATPEGQAKAKAYRHAHRAANLVYVQKRKALKLAAAVNLSKIEEWVTTIRAKPSAVCYYCDKRIATDGYSLHFDHIIPLSKGGPHSVENLCVSCPACNLRKSDKPVRLWIRAGQQLLEL